MNPLNQHSSESRFRRWLRSRREAKHYYDRYDEYQDCVVSGCSLHETGLLFPSYQDWLDAKETCS